MNVNQLTQKSIEAVQAAQQAASERGNTRFRSFIYYTRFWRSRRLIGSILSATGVEVGRFREDAEREMNSLPTYSGGSGAEQIYVFARSQQRVERG
jgi:ATP-dependent Clp protease ATP-binding subunit ClpB